MWNTHLARNFRQRVCPIDDNDYQEIMARNADKNMRKFTPPTMQDKWRYMNIKVHHDTADGFEVKYPVPFRSSEISVKGRLING